MTSGYLDVPEGNTGVEGGHDERSPDICGCTCPRPARLPIERIQDGQRIRVNGTDGYIEILPAT